jgi:hypothetical protein
METACRKYGEECTSTERRTANVKKRHFKISFGKVEIKKTAYFFLFFSIVGYEDTKK